MKHETCLENLYSRFLSGGRFIRVRHRVKVECLRKMTGGTLEARLQQITEDIHSLMELRDATVSREISRAERAEASLRESEEIVKRLRAEIANLTARHKALLNA